MTVSNRTLILTLIGLSLAIIATGLGIGDETAALIFDEGGIVETLTATLYGLAAIMTLGAAGFEFNRNGATRHACGLIVLCLLSLFLVAEEISLWVFFLDSEPPRVLGIRMDAAHDLLHLGLKSLKVVLAYSIPIGLTLIGAIVLPAGAIFWRFRDMIVSVIRQSLASRAGLFIAVCFALGVVALGADLRSETWPAMKFIEESLELSASLALALAAYFATSMRVFVAPMPTATFSGRDA